MKPLNILIAEDDEWYAEFLEYHIRLICEKCHIIKVFSGKKLLESAIQKDLRNIELRFFRFSTQSNVPALLNYSSNINEDKMILMNYLKISSSTTDKDLYQRIKSYMLKSTYCSASEKQQLTTT
jgi:hypothetical protein